MTKLHTPVPAQNRLSVRFALRPAKPGQTYSNPHPLQVWITVNRKRTHFAAQWQGDYLRVNPEEWRQDKQTTALQYGQSGHRRIKRPHPGYSL